MFNTTLIGKKIATLRKENNLTQMDLADIMGVSYQAVSNWERGNSMPDISKLTTLTTALNINIEDLLEDTKPVELIKHVIEGTEESFIENNNVTADHLVEVAPILKPTQTKSILQKIITETDDTLTIDELLSLAPFLETEYLDRLAEKQTENQQVSDLVALAPFLSTEAIDKAALKLAQTNLHELIALAPFIGSQTLDALAMTAEGDANFEELIALAPFLSEETLSSIAHRFIENGGSVKNLAGLAPFLSKTTLSILADEIVKTEGVKALIPLMPFLD